MRDKNIVMLEGVVGYDVKKGKTSDGKRYITFTLCIDAFFRPLHDNTESDHRIVYVRIFCFDKVHVDYLERCRIRRGQRVSVFGRLQSSSHEVKGQKVVDVSVVVRDISIFKSSDDYEYTETELAEMKEAVERTDAKLGQAKLAAAKAKKVNS